jgi:hypothetical protein
LEIARSRSSDHDSSPAHIPVTAAPDPHPWPFPPFVTAKAGTASGGPLRPFGAAYGFGANRYCLHAAATRSRCAISHSCCDGVNGFTTIKVSRRNAGEASGSVAEGRLPEGFKFSSMFPLY